MSRVLDEHGTARSRKVFALNEFNGVRYFEIEEHFLNRKEGEWRKKKGVSLNRDTYRILHSLVQQRHEDIMTWIGIGYVPEDVSRYAELQEAAMETNKTTGHALEVGTYSEDRDSRFFTVSHEGGADIVRFNDTHPMFAHVADLTPDAQKLVAQILQSFSRAKALLADTPAFDPGALFMHLEEDWSRFLRDASKE